MAKDYDTKIADEQSENPERGEPPMQDSEGFPIEDVEDDQV